MLYYNRLDLGKRISIAKKLMALNLKNQFVDRKIELVRIV